MTTEFSTLPLHPGLVQRAGELGFYKLTEVQSRVIPLILAGKDVLAQSQTGSGKTAAFAFPILHQLMTDSQISEVTTLVLAPTRELAIQVAEAFMDYGQHLQVSVLPVYGGQHYGTSRRRLKEGVDVVVGTPGRLKDLIRQGILDLSHVKNVILDEADEMLSMGFVDDVESILKETPAIRQTTLFSATLPGQIRKLSEIYLREPETVMVQQKELTVDTVDQRYYLIKENDKLAGLIRLFEAEDIAATLVFTKTRVGSDRLANSLNQAGYQAEALNGDLAQDARLRVLNRFKAGDIKVLVATDVAARGLDIDDISHVFNYDVPTDPEAYVHRIGRTGRAGKKGTAILFLTPRDKSYLSRIESFSKHKLTQAQFPTEKDLLERREIRIIEQLENWLETDSFQREEELVSYLAASGHDPLKVAAAALKMARRADAEQPISRISTVQFKDKKRGARNSKRRSQPARKSARRRNSTASAEHERGMVRFTLNRGRSHGINPGEIVGGIASRADIPGSGIGRITINQENTLVDIKEEFATAVLNKSGSYHFKRHHNMELIEVKD